MAQMPEEGRKFGIVDMYWRDIMKQSVKDTHCLVVTSQHNMLPRLTEANVLLEDIQKGLNDYLEKKRLYFPRSVRHTLQTRVLHVGIIIIIIVMIIIILRAQNTNK